MPSFRRTYPLPVVLLLLAACTESPSGPREEVDQLDSLVVTATVLETRLSSIPDQSPWIECRVRIDARAAGPMDGPVELLRIDHALFTGLDRENPADTIIATRNRLDVEFGDRTVYATPLTSEWDLRADAPFVGRGAVQYEDHTGDDGVAPFEFRCGPIVDDGSTVALPVVTELSFVPSGETVELGTPVQIMYEASSPIGLWETWVIVTHAFGTDTVRLNEGLIENTARTISYHHPSNSPAGDRMSVRVVTFDALLRPAEIAPALTPALSDTTPPWVGHVSFAGGPFSGCTAAACAVGAGDSIPVTLNSFDHSSGTTLRLSYSGPLDLTHEVALAYNGWLQFRAPPVETPGIYDVTASLRDRNGNDTTFSIGAVNVYPQNDAATLRTAVVPGHPSWLVRRFAVPDFVNQRLYVYSSTDSASSVHVFGLPDLNPLPALELTGMPGGLDVGPDGVVIATVPAAHAVELRTGDGSLVRTIPITALPASAGFEPHDVVRTSAGTLLVALNRGIFYDGAGMVIEIDTAAATQTVVLDSTSSGGRHYELSRSGEATRVVATRYDAGCGGVYDVAAGTLTSCGSYVHQPPRGNLDGTRWTTWAGVYDAGLTQVSPLGISSSWATAPHPTDVAILFAVTERGVVTYRAADRVILESHPGIRFSSGTLWISPDGALAIGAGQLWASGSEDVQVFTVTLD